MPTRPALSKDIHFGFLNNAIDAPKIYNPKLIANDAGNHMLDALKDELRRATKFTFSVAFISNHALAMIKEDILQFVDRGGTGEFITSDYLDFNSPSAFRELLEIDGIKSYVHHDEVGGFHAKGYVFHHLNDTEISAIIGSSNLTGDALLRNQEWNLQFSTSTNGDIALQLVTAVERQKLHATLLTQEWIDLYESRRAQPIFTPRGCHDRLSHIEANAMQRQALTNLRDLRLNGKSKALIISATGTGKTILSALAVREATPSRVLFIVHREQILSKALFEFRRVLKEPADQFGLYVGNKRQAEAKYLFASIQSLSRNDNFRQFEKDTFDYIIIDEVHRSAAHTYQEVLGYFTPEFLLGLTATPERTDGKDIFEFFDYNTAYEIQLQAALEADMLAPFHYYGVTDFTYHDGTGFTTADDVSDLKFLVSAKRVDHVLKALRQYGHPQDVHGLVFCSTQAEALEMSDQFNHHSIFGRQLRTKVLLGSSSLEERQKVVEELETGQLDYIFTVDIFNEGIDIPKINQVVMLRSTKSSIIFTQQLGRGLRKAAGKDHLRVIDFIGNYKNNFLIPIALYGDASRDRDKITRQLIESRRIGGMSTVNFDRIAKERIYESLAKAPLNSLAEFKKDIQDLVFRLNRIPRLSDFVVNDSTDPVILATTRTKNYWELLKRIKFIDIEPTSEENEYLKFLSKELLPGKQPQELVLISLLLKQGTLSRKELVQTLDSKGMTHSSEDLSVMERVLNLSFYSEQAYHFPGIVRENAGEFTLDESFAKLYHAAPSQWPSNFAAFVDDIIETGLLLARKKGYWSGALKCNNRYSRKDVSRLLHLKTNQAGTLNGYKVDRYSGAIPIFVNYHKSINVDSSVAYDDHFDNTRTMTWFTRSRRSLHSQEVIDIVTEKYPIHLFVRRDDTSGDEFFYLGKVSPRDATEETMKDNKGHSIGVVKMKLDLDTPISEGFLTFLESADDPQTKSKSSR